MKLENRIKELIAIGASVSANCMPCIEYHIGKAREYGVEKDEIEQAIETGKLVRRGAAANMDKHAAKLMNSAEKETAAANHECACGN